MPVSNPLLCEGWHLSATARELNPRPRLTQNCAAVAVSTLTVVVDLLCSQGTCSQSCFSAAIHGTYIGLQCDARASFGRVPAARLVLLLACRRQFCRDLH